MKAVTGDLAGDVVGGLETAKCAHCDQVLGARAYSHASQIAHALEECRNNLKAQREREKKEAHKMSLLFTKVLDAWASEGVKRHDDVYDRARYFLSHCDER